MAESLGWAKRPMLQRVHQLPPSMPLTMLYGARSWVDSSSGQSVVQIRNQALTKVIVSRNVEYSHEMCSSSSDRSCFTRDCCRLGISGNLKARTDFGSHKCPMGEKEKVKTFFDSTGCKLQHANASLTGCLFLFSHLFPCS